MAEETTPAAPAAPKKAAPRKPAATRKAATAAPASDNQSAGKRASSKPAAAKVRETAKAATGKVKAEAATIAGKAKTAARDYASQGKARTEETLDTVSGLIHDAAGTVDERLGADYGEYVRKAASVVASLSGNLKKKDVEQLVDDTRDFVRKSPAVAIGAAAAIGFILVRLAKSGSDEKTARNRKDKPGKQA